MGRADLSLSSVDMNELVQQAIDGLSSETKGRRIEWQIEILPRVQADADMMRQVWVNLLANAVKYTRSRTPACIQVGCDVSQPNDYIFFVRDNGIGFNMQYVHKLFGVFQRLHRENEFEGTGIGLANVRRIVNRHGGRTMAEGELDLGAKFSFTLRKASAEQPPNGANSR